MYSVAEKPFYIITLNTLPPNLFKTEMKSVPTMGAINMCQPRITNKFMLRYTPHKP